MHLSLGNGCISALTEPLLGKSFSQKKTNSSTSEFWFSSAFLSVGSLWPNEEKGSINFFTSERMLVAPGLVVLHVGGCCVTFGVFHLPATAETACCLKLPAIP